MSTNYVFIGISSLVGMRLHPLESLAVELRLCESLVLEHLVLGRSCLSLGLNDKMA